MAKKKKSSNSKINTIHHPHDAVFKASMKNLKVARDVIENNTPEVFKAIALWDTLQPESSNYIDNNLGQSYSDMLYSVQTTKGKAYIYFLCEAQVEPVEMMPLRLFEYLVFIMRDHLNKGHKKLPLVLPIVLYSGKKFPYPHTTDIYELFDSPKMARDLMFKPFKLIDLSVIDDHTLLEQKWGALLQMIMKHIRGRDIIKTLEMLAEHGTIAYLHKHDGKNYLKSVLYYILDREENKAEFLEAIKHSVKDLEGDVMSIVEESRQEGMQAKQHEIAKNMLRKHLDDSIVSETTGLASDIIVKLKKEIKH